MTRRTQESLVAALTDYGLQFRHVTVVSEGDYPVADADWNYKDVPHLNQIHHLANNVSGVIDADAVASITLQTIFGVRSPVVLSHYDSGPDRQTYFFTLLMYTIVCETTFEVVTPTRTRVVTDYAVGSGSFWMRLFPLVAWTLRRNYRALMSEDLPMRDRRGQLRRWGYSFRGDGRPRTFTTSVAIEKDNVLAPSDPALPPVPPARTIPLASIGADRWTRFGRNDHLGLKLQRRGDEVHVYPRMCPHEGADLDPIPAERCRLECPWHGRLVGPVATLDLDGGAATTPFHHIEVAGGEVRIRCHAEGAGPPDGSGPHGNLLERERGGSRPSA